MEMTGRCHICGKIATQSCRICGLMTCDEHLRNGVCLECRRGQMIDKEKKEKSLQHDVYS